MRYFETKNNKIRAIDKGQEFLIKNDWVEVPNDKLQEKLTERAIPTPNQEKKFDFKEAYIEALLIDDVQEQQRLKNLYKQMKENSKKPIMKNK